jgi:hypothetical protein
MQICKLSDFCQRIANIEPGNVNEMKPDSDDLQIPCLTNYNKDFHNFKETWFIIQIPQSRINDKRSRNKLNKQFVEAKEK